MFRSALLLPGAALVFPRSGGVHFSFFMVVNSVFWVRSPAMLPPSPSDLATWPDTARRSALVAERRGISGQVAKSGKGGKGGRRAGGFHGVFSGGR